MPVHLKVFSLIVFCSLGIVLSGWWVYRPVFELWLQSDSAYSHGALLVGYGFYLVWLKLSESSSIGVVRPSYLGLAILFALLCLSFLAQLALTGVVVEALFPALLLAIIYGVFGRSVVKICFLPILLVVFALPVWDYIGYPLQLLTVLACEYILEFTGIAFEVSETFITLPGIGIFEVASGCSGLRYFLIATVLSLIVADQWLSSISTKVKVVALGVAAGLITNWVRVSVIIYIGHDTQMTSTLIDDHETFGWLLFSGMLVPYIYYCRKLSDFDKLKLQDKIPLINDGDHSVKSYINRSSLISTFILFPVLTAMGIAAAPDISGPSKNLDLTFSIDGWKKMPMSLPSPVGTKFNRAPIYLEQMYINESGQSLYLGVYAYPIQSEGSELVQYGNRFYQSRLWRARPYKFEGAEVARPLAPWVINELSLAEHSQLSSGNKSKSFLQLAGYVVSGHRYNDRKLVKLHQLAAGFIEDSRQYGFSAVFSCSDQCLDQDAVSLQKWAVQIIKDLESDPSVFLSKSNF